MSEANIKVVPIECMGTQCVEVQIFGKTKLILLEDRANELFWALATVLIALSVKEKRG